MRFIQNLFKPKWQHSNPSVRKQALLALDKDAAESQSIFSEIAAHDEVIELRQQAIRQLSDIKLLADISRNDLDSEVRELAGTIWYQYLSGRHDLSPSMDDLTVMLDQISDDKAISHIALHGKTAELRLFVVKKVDREALLGDIAIKDKSLDVRVLALQRIKQKSTLERVYKATRTKDKKISRASKDRLNVIFAAEAKPAQLREQRRSIILILEGLGKKGMWEREKDVFDRSIKQWQAIEDEADEASLVRFANAQTMFLQGYAEYQERQAERLAQDAKYAPIRDEKLTIIAALEVLEIQLEQTNADDLSTLEAMLKECRSASTQWHHLGTLPDEDEQNLQARFSPLHTRLRSRIEEQLDTAKVTDVIGILFKRAENLLNNRGKLTEKSIAEFESRWNALQMPISYAEASNSKAQYQQWLSKLKSKLQHQVKAITKTEESLRQYLDKMQEALDGGALKQAEEQRKKAQKLISKLDLLSKNHTSKWRKQFQESARGLTELSKWRSWANTPQKERLCENVEALAGSDEDPLEIAQAIKVAQTAWKNLGPSEQDSSQALWERFQRACEAAYEPCKAYFADQSEVRKEALMRREAFLDKLDKFVAEIDWETIDWKKTEQLEHQSRDEWRALGATDRKFKTKLNRRFNNLLRLIQSKVKAEWGKNYAIKQALVEQAQALADETELNKAISRCKTLQTKWKQAGRVAQKDEQALWKVFRGHCDTVFNLRDQKRDQQIKAKEGLVQKKTEICEQVEQIAMLDNASILTQDSRYAQLMQQWQNCEPTEKKLDAELFERFQSACANVAVQKVLQKRLEQANKLKAMRIKANMCEALEHLLDERSVANFAELFAAAKNDWQASAALDEPNEILLGQRYARVIQWAEKPDDLDGWAAYQQTNAEQLAILSLKLEILLSIESPAAAAKDRLRVQVERLSTEMGVQQNNTLDLWQRFIELEIQWLSLGSVAQNLRDDLVSRQHQILQAMTVKYPQEIQTYQN